MSITHGAWINIKYNNKIYKGFVFSLEGNEAVVNAYVPIIGPSSFIVVERGGRENPVALAPG